MLSHSVLDSPWALDVSSLLFFLVFGAFLFFFPSQFSFIVLEGTLGDRDLSGLSCLQMGQKSLKNGCTLKIRFLLYYERRKIVKNNWCCLQRPPLKCSQGQRDLNNFSLWLSHTTISEKPWEACKRCLMTSWNLLKLELFVHICLCLLNTARNFTLG